MTDCWHNFPFIWDINLNDSHLHLLKFLNDVECSPSNALTCRPSMIRFAQAKARWV